MKIAILYWFYKELEVTRNHLELIKKTNPDLKVYGLFGGDKKDAADFRNGLNGLLDDFYICPSDDTHWKWLEGDLALLDWYEQRGKSLEWDSIAIVQWDMLVFDSLKNVFCGLKKDQIFLSGTRLLTPDIESKWSWTKKDNLKREKEGRKQYLEFKKYLSEKYDYQDQLLCCLFIFEIFPRIFWEKFSTLPDNKLGMLEYKIPTYAKIFQIPFYEKDIGVWWFEDKAKIPLNARMVEIKDSYIKEELGKKGGWRIFHPYFKSWIDV